MEKSVIHKLTIGIISIILSIIVIAVQINVIKTAIELERTPPVYLLQTYTVMLAGAVISYLVYFSISQGVDVYRIIEKHKKNSNWLARTKADKESTVNYIEREKLALKTLDQTAEPMNEPNPIDNTIDEVDKWKASMNSLDYMLTNELSISKKIKDWQESMENSNHIEMATEGTANPIDLKFAPLEDKAKEVLDNLKQKRDVQK